MSERHCDIIRFLVLSRLRQPLCDTVYILEHSWLISEQSGHLSCDWFRESFLPVNRRSVKCNTSQWRKNIGREGQGRVGMFFRFRFQNLAVFRSFLLSIYNLQVLPTAPLKTFKTQFRHTKAQMTPIICRWFV